MKKFSKMLALGMALSLAFGVTVFAGSVTVDTSGLEEDVEFTLDEGSLEVGEKLVAVDMPAEDQASVEAEIEEPETVAAISEALNIASDKKATLKLATTFEIEVQDAGGNVVKKNGITLTFNWTGFEVSKKYAVLHYNGTRWEVIPATVTADGVQATFSSLSPVAIVEVGEEAADNNNNNNNNNNSQTPSQPEAPKSPQTGEALPVVGIMALICLAGAAVCAGKVRCSKQ